MKPVRLRNGAEEYVPLVVATMTTLHTLAAERPVSFIELVAVCRNPTHTPWGNTAADLRAYGLIGPTGLVHDSVRNIVLSAVTGEDAAIELGNPLAEPVPA